MIGNPELSIDSQSASIASCGALPTAAPIDVGLRNDGHAFWNHALGEMLRSTSAMVMLATSKTPAQWIVRELKCAGELSGTVNAATKDSKRRAALTRRRLNPFDRKRSTTAKR